MAQSRSIQPPEFSEDGNWIDYKKELKIWQALTELPPSKQGPSVFFSFKGKAKTAALELDIEDIKKDDGVDTILKRLDKLYLQETSQSAYLAYHEFETFKRPRTMPIKEYLIKYDSLYNKIKCHEMEIPDGVLAYRVLNSANLNEDEMRLCRATLSELKYDLMIKQLTKIFGDEVSCTLKEVKEESVFETSLRQQGYYQRNRNSRGRGGRSRYQQARNTAVDNKEQDSGNGQKKKLNPIIDGKLTRCNGCGSKFHWFMDCPDIDLVKERQQSDGNEEIVLEVAQVDNEKMKELVGETICCGFLDSACSQTVCGQSCLNCFKQSQGPVKLERKVSTRKFKFGSGKSVDSLGIVALPIQIGEKKLKLMTDVVESDIPLLISKDAMKKANTVLDFTNDTVSMFGKAQKLLRSSSGHYAIPVTESCHLLQSSLDDTKKKVSDCCLMAISIDDDKRKIILKLHWQFCHCSAEKLKKLIYSSELWKDEVVRDL